jgi:hypothetical protein
MESSCSGLTGEDINSRTLEIWKKQSFSGISPADMAVTVGETASALSQPLLSRYWQNFWRTYMLVKG